MTIEEIVYRADPSQKPLSASPWGHNCKFRLVITPHSVTIVARYPWDRAQARKLTQELTESGFLAEALADLQRVGISLN